MRGPGEESTLVDGAFGGATNDRRLGAWFVRGRLSVGGMAEVHAAVAVAEPTRRAVIKRLLPHLAEEPAAARRFAAEVALLKQLDSPGVAPVLDADLTDGQCWFVAPWVWGLDLARLAALVPTPWPASVVAALAAAGMAILADVHGATDAAGHPLGIVHRDVSPHNLMLDREGGLWLVDFGVARAERFEQHTATGVLNARHAYLSPERLQPGVTTIDGRSDVFSLAVVLWELATGQRLFLGHDPADTLDRVAACNVPDPRILVPELPSSLALALLACLESERDARPPNAAAASLMFASAMSGDAGIRRGVHLRHGAMPLLRAFIDAQPAAISAIAQLETRFSPSAARATLAPDPQTTASPPA